LVFRSLSLRKWSSCLSSNQALCQWLESPLFSWSSCAPSHKKERAQETPLTKLLDLSEDCKMMKNNYLTQIFDNRKAYQAQDRWSESTCLIKTTEQLTIKQDQLTLVDHKAGPERRCLGHLPTSISYFSSYFYPLGSPLIKLFKTTRQGVLNCRIFSRSTNPEALFTGSRDIIIIAIYVTGDPCCSPVLIWAIRPEKSSKDIISWPTGDPCFSPVLIWAIRPEKSSKDIISWPTLTSHLVDRRWMKERQR